MSDAYGSGMTGGNRWSWLRDPRAEERAFSRAFARQDPLWPGQLAILVALGLFLILPPKLTFGPNWPMPIAEAAIVAALFIAGRRGGDPRRRREIAIAIVLFATLANLTALGLLVHYLVTGGHEPGTDLLGGGVLIWTTNLLLFAVVFWELDRGGPRPAAADGVPVAPDFLFPDQPARPDWQPRFLDYLYVSLTNQAAFSPTDTMPLTARAKILMATQSVAALVTVGVIVARAVNVLG